VREAIRSRQVVTTVHEDGIAVKNTTVVKKEVDGRHHHEA
jgi:hypothetical protein